jgi:Fungalysin/Thermolysin Propeptide Motif
MAVRSGRTRWFVAASIVCLSATPLAKEQRPAGGMRLAPDFDIRDRRGMTAESPRAAQAARELRASHPGVVARYDGRRGIRTFHAPVSGLSGPDRRGSADVARTFLSSADSALLDLDPEDVETTLRLRANTESSLARLVYFDQSIDGVPVFDGVVAIHLAADGRVIRLVSAAASPHGCLRGGIVGAEEAVRLAAGSVRTELDTLHPFPIEREDGPEQRTRMARGPLASEPVASLVYFAMDGQLRSAWHVVVQPEGTPRPYDIIVDARTGRILLRRIMSVPRSDQGSRIGN